MKSTMEVIRPNLGEGADQLGNSRKGTRSEAARKLKPAIVVIVCKD